ncbi:hypothetical protein KY337_00855 [Candidatus Woesearchaeota archaeon]|nr:hypothetical protein [Candidatus Woesearchaeota archaeon]
MSLTSKISKLMVGIAAAGMLMAAPVKAEPTRVFQLHKTGWKEHNNYGTKKTPLFSLDNSADVRKPVSICIKDKDGLDSMTAIYFGRAYTRDFDFRSKQGFCPTSRAWSFEPSPVTERIYLLYVRDRSEKESKIRVHIHPWHPNYSLTIGDRLSFGLNESLGVGRPFPYHYKPEEKIELHMPKQGNFDPDEYIRNIPQDDFKIRKLKQYRYRIMPLKPNFDVEGIGSFTRIR